jgi:hypothetical protein
MHKYIKNPILEIPAFILFLLACWMVVYNVGAIVQYFVGSLLMILTMPLWWYYIVSPILDIMWEFFEVNFWN